MQVITVNTTSEYCVYIERGSLAKAGEIITNVFTGKAMLITDTNVDELYAESLADSLKQSGLRVSKFVLPAGEASKNPQNLNAILSDMAENNFYRKDIVISLGGGMVGDIAGFAAAVYMRGIKYVHIPTTILAAVDSSLGGKTGVNLPEGKNLMGAFHQPALVICDPELFFSLPEREKRNGFAEIIKYGMIRDEEILEKIEAIQGRARISDDISEIICRCVRIKADIASRDEFEKGERQILNFGHSIGHALETLSNYSISHGEAVACGMLIMTEIAVREGLCEKECSEVLAKVLRICALPCSCEFTAKEIAAAMASDKKASGESINLILPVKLGQVEIVSVKFNDLPKLLNESDAIHRITLDIYGSSHADRIGMKLKGIDAGHDVNMGELQSFLDSRAPGTSEYASQRKENDIPEFLSGIEYLQMDDETKSTADYMKAARTNGDTIEAVIYNRDARPQDYYGKLDSNKIQEKKITVPRPGHADYASWLKYGRIEPGGGKWSGRMTAPMCIAGGIVKQLLKEKKIDVVARIYSIGEVCGTKEEMLTEIARVKAEKDSVGGVVECEITWMPPGIGDALFDGIESEIARNVFAIPAVKGIEFGKGFECTKLKGSENNDEYHMEGSSVRISTNNHGGILGGISTGMPIVFRVAFKPTPSIGLEQNSVDLATMTDVKIKTEGRHDPCIVPRAVPCVEAAAALAIFDMLG